MTPPGPIRRPDMRVAFFSPMPPAKSGIADYSQALLGPLSRLAEVAVFDGCAGEFDPARFDAALYQIGNNPHHALAYETALRHPGVVAIHEANLHHLVADLTIRRGDWDGYLRECEYDGGPAALAHARRVRALEVGPDYEGVPMLRRLLAASRAAIVHSRYMEDALRARGFTGPVARIPHGAWIPEADRNGWRHRLGLDETAPLVGVFGFLKPYKRIAESLRAFRRLVRLAPQARMILVGEPHPELPVEDLIHSLGLPAHVRVLGFTPIDDFTGYMAACDIVLNLRYPTVGESSGSMLRAMGLGKAVLASDVGAFQEFPDDVCLKVPVGAGEEDLIFECLNLLAARPDAARAMGARARRYVERECSWDNVARRYAEFIADVVEPVPHGRGSVAAPSRECREGVAVAPGYIRGWAAAEPARAYAEIHMTRLVKTLSITPPGGPGDCVLEMGAYLQMTPALKTKLGYPEVRGCYYGPAGATERRETVSAGGERFACEIDLFDAERDPFPYPDAHFSTVLCCELIEHLAADPMHMMAEINRILKPGGSLVLTTPNIASLRAISAILQGYHPGFFSAYIRPPESGRPEARHNREYTPREIGRLLDDAGFEPALLETGPFLEEPRPEHGWVLHLLERYQLPADLRGDGIYAVGRKTGPVRQRHPSWLYG
jgi:glycosyltransferase involved in cell wall biosynthesis/SAM-dependent methyltransferase